MVAREWFSATLEQLHGTKVEPPSLLVIGDGCRCRLRALQRQGTPFALLATLGWAVGRWVGWLGRQSWAALRSRSTLSTFASTGAVAGRQLCEILEVPFFGGRLAPPSTEQNRAPVLCTVRYGCVVANESYGG